MILGFIRQIFGVNTLPEFAMDNGPHVVYRDPRQNMLYVESRKNTPNITAKKKICPTHILLHHTSGRYDGSVSWCMSPESRVSYHCIISNLGKRTVLADPTQRAWHAGISEGQGRKNCNDYCVGAAFEMDTYTTPPSEDALVSMVEYLIPIINEYNIPVTNIIRHADVSPGRKNDCSPQALSAIRAIVSKIIK
jgi:N-acetyl-anhydromuramyl-L-alanine amidase AmpD